MGKTKRKPRQLLDLKKFRFLIGLKFKDSILGKLAITFVSIIAITLFLVGIVTSENIKKEVKNNFISSTEQILVQNQNYVDFIFSTVENYSMQLFSDMELREKLIANYSRESEKYKAIGEINQKLKGIILTNSMIESIYILNPQGISVREPALQMYDIDLNNFKETTLYKKAKDINSTSFWIPPNIDEFTLDKTTKIISEVRKLNNLNSGSDFGLLQINISPKTFQNALSNAKIGKQGYMFILDNDGYIISHPDSKLLGTNIKSSEQAKKILSSKSDNGSFAYSDSQKKIEMFSVYSKSKKTGWNYIAVVPNKELTLSADKIRSIIIIISLVCMLLAFAVSMFISANIIKPLKEVNFAMARMETGDLTAAVKHKSRDELGDLSNNFNSMVIKLKNLISSVKDAVVETNSDSNMIGSSSEQLAISATEVSRVISEIAFGAGNQAQQAVKGLETAEGFGKEVESVVAYSGDVFAVSMDAMRKAESGRKSVVILKDKSKDSVAIIKKVSESISEMSQNAREIEEILKSITSISQQTNLLSLNAAIEAARAGEAGKGFAVVADEVRKLADESKLAADNINIILKNVNIRTKDSIDTSKSIASMLEEQAEHINDTLDVFDGIKDSIDKVGNKLNKLNGAVDNLNGGKCEILRAIEEISAISRDTAAATEEISASAEEQVASVEEMNSMTSSLNGISMKLKELTDKFIIN